MEEQGGGPQEMAFVSETPSWFGAEMQDLQAQGRQPHQKPPSGQRAPPWTHEARFTGSLGSCPWNWKLSLPPRGPHYFPWTTPPGTSPTPAEAECQGRTRDLGPRRGAGHGSAPGGAGPSGRDPRPRTGSPPETQACAPPGLLRVLLWLKLPHPAPRWQTWTQRLHSLKSGLNCSRRDCGR